MKLLAAGLALVAATAVSAQTQAPDQPAEQSAPANEPADNASGQGQQPAQTQCNPQQQHPSLVKDAGSAAAVTGGQVAGAAVAGPVGAAVGGVVVDHAGRAVKKLLGKKKHSKAEQTDQCGARDGQNGDAQQG